MNYLIDLYIKKPEDVKNLFKQKVNISVKVDGSAFQIHNNDGEITYHKRGGSSSKLGPVIDDYTQLFAKQLNDAIEYFNKRIEKVSIDQFYAIEILEGGTYVLLNVIDYNGNIINAGKELDAKAKDLDIVSVPLLFDGMLDDKTAQMLIDMCTLAEDTTNDDFKKLLFNAFKINNDNYKKLLNNEEIEGIVLTWNIDDQIIQYKIINPAFKKRHEASQAVAKEKAEQNKDKLNDLLKFLLDNFEKNAEKLSTNWLKNLELNFLKMISDKSFTKDLLKLASKVTPNESKYFFLQMNKVSKEIKALIDKYGISMTTAYEQFLMTFNKERKRNYIIDKEFQQRTNNLIKSIQESMMPLKNYLFEYLLSKSKTNSSVNDKFDFDNKEIQGMLEQYVEPNYIKMFNHTRVLKSGNIELISDSMAYKGQYGVIHRGLKFVLYINSNPMCIRRMFSTNYTKSEHSWSTPPAKQGEYDTLENLMKGFNDWLKKHILAN